jgi:L-aspartate oxidase
MPAAHYHMGGVATDLWGATSLPGLLAAGECAAVGVHGANRLASNSLLEAAVFGRRAGEAARDAIAARGPVPPTEAPPTLPHGALQSLRRAMSRDAGVARDETGLGELIDTLDAAEAQHGEALPLVAARLVAEAALDRRESRGAHCRADFPAEDACAAHTLVTLDTDAVRRRRAA